MMTSLKIKSVLLFSLYFGLASFHYLDRDTGAVHTNTDKVAAKELPVTSYFLSLLSAKSEKSVNAIIDQLDAEWDSSYEIFLLETLYFSQNTRTSSKLLKLLQNKTNKSFGYDLDKWYQWLWNKDKSYPDDYFAFKAALHEGIDAKFSRYFLDREKQATIRLDEVRWGGVLQDGIPPLRQPKMLGALEATYLKDKSIVFGIEVNGDARAYPKQILAWHEMFVDTVGGEDVAGVYCTLCGTVILYKTEHDGIKHQMGTSGFLYRSNKLMYDKATQSLWSTLDGEPVIGPLVGKDIQLEYLSVVTTTWGEWKKRHPDTKVLSLNTGHRRDYREGVAYKDYFATDDLMFTVPTIDSSLNNKDEILAVRIPEERDLNIAISSKFLKKNEVYQSKIGKVDFTVFTDKTGAHRVFKTKGITFPNFDGQRTATDEKGGIWTIKENLMVHQDGTTLERFPTHNAFWFGYKAAYPDVELIK